MAMFRDSVPFGEPMPAPVRARDRRSRLAVVALAFAAVLPPLALIVRPADFGHISGAPVAAALTALLIVAPALCGLVTALFGLDRGRESGGTGGVDRPDGAVHRVFVGVLAVAYCVALAALLPSEAAAAALIVACIGLGAAWLVLPLAIVGAPPALPRRYLMIALDAAFVSALLHVGGAVAAPWIALYLLAAVDAGFRGGVVALAASAAANFCGFAAVVATTPYWQDQPLLAGGLLAALVALPALVGRIVVESAESREAAAAAQAARTRFLMVVSQALRAPLDAMAGTPKNETATAPASRALLSQVNNILDFTAIEAGAFVPATEPFDLHRLVNETLAERRIEAAKKGLVLRVQIEPTLPYRLRGWPRQLAQILDYLTARAIEVTAEGAVRVRVAAGGGDRRRKVRIAVCDGGTPIAPAATEALPGSGTARSHRAGAEHGGFGLAVVRRLVELMGGEIGVGGTGDGGVFAVTVPLAVEEPGFDSTLDLERCVVMIATEDSQFASDLAEPLNAWNGDARWIDNFDATVDFAERRDEKPCSVLIVDGRQRRLAALSFAHRAAVGGSGPSFVLFVADAAQTAGLAELGADELDAVLPAPLDNRLLANALHALPLWCGAPARPVIVPAREAPSPPAPLAAPHITPIVAHPRFAAEAPTLDPRAVTALRDLGGGDAFLGEVLDSFRADAREIMQSLGRAAAAADGAGFARGLHALRSCAANLGGTRLCELLLSLREVGAPELRERGSVLVQRLGDELDRLDCALADLLPSGAPRREAQA